MSDQKIIEAVQRNCDISDARDSGIYTVCILVLKLRNYYKWERGLEPWDEPGSAEVLDWIAAKEEFWAGIADEDFLPLPIKGGRFDPFEPGPINEELAGRGRVYGAGYGRSMKSIFFLAEQLDQRLVEGCPVTIMGRESARELASPFAMLQDGGIFIRREPMRFYFWDQIREIRPSGKAAMRYSLGRYGLLGPAETLDRALLREKLDSIVDREMEAIIHHEVGEMLEKTLDSLTLKKIVGFYPGSAIEFLARSVKDVLADTHENGMLGHIIGARKESSLGFYVAFLDGMRKTLFPEIVAAFSRFAVDGDWQVIEEARAACRCRNIARAGRLVEICQQLAEETVDRTRARLDEELLAPLGLGVR